MQNVNANWQQHIARNVTQICHCLKLSNGMSSLFLTDHDRPLNLLSDVYAPDENLMIGPVKFSRNLVDDGFEIKTQIADDGISYDLLKTEFLTEAKYEIYQVNWANTAEYNLLKMGVVGEVVVADSALSLTLYGIAKPLSNRYGRLLQEKCDAQFGDPRCNIYSGLPIYNASGSAGQILSAHRFEVDLPSGIADGYFDNGDLILSQQKLRIHSQTKLTATTHLIVLKRAPKVPIENSDAVSLRVGCDKSFDTCDAKYSNAANFMGFAHMPGKDFEFAYPQRALLEE